MMLFMGGNLKSSMSGSENVFIKKKSIWISVLGRIVLETLFIFSMKSTFFLTVITEELDAVK